jgi:transposase
MDMNTAFDLEVKKHCRKAKVVYDLFHVIAKYGREVIDRVRVDEANRHRNDKPARQFIKRGRWLVLRNPQNVPADQVPVLEKLLAANRDLMTVYVMKASLKELWQPTCPWRWRAAWRNWLAMAQASGIEPCSASPDVWACTGAASWHACTGRCIPASLGINNRIKVMKRMAYGYRDSEFFFMKIKAAFPGNP